MTSDTFIGYQCSLCSKTFGVEEVTYTCPIDGGNLDVLLDYDAIKRQRGGKIVLEQEPSLWRYLPLLPVSDPGGHETPLRAAGWTPIYAPSDLGKELGLEHLWVKDESRNPTASFKDRASAILVARAREINAEVIVTASTGNAGAALAGMAAAVNQKSVIFAPKTAPAAKIAQLLIYGAEVLLVDGNYDAAFDLSVAASEEFSWYCRNTGYNPFTAEGKKTAAFEIWEALLRNERKVRSDRNISDAVIYKLQDKPLSIFVSVGDGNIISGIHKGFKDLLALGMIEKIPRIFGVQSEESAAISNAFNAGTEVIKPVHATTRADSISVDMPRDGVRALRAATQTGGAYVTVPDEEILLAISELGKAGIFSEPAGSAAYAGMKAAVRSGLVEPDDPILVFNTGSGLKDIEAAMQSAGEAPIIQPTLESVRKHLK
ncbi:threonine synthase [bacterium SM23_57]|nr:MAG: threonine synthase [bacterium SM23_57]